ncbi:TraR/DksA family transcriptional regulator [Gammaproteobacteria bacterium LSUCC0112]|nr:TraR/DksA family transcriptional regulator [Gammaproteobacteria bacterium LSUCC0112]
MLINTSIDVNNIIEKLNSLHHELNNRLVGIQNDLSRGRSQDSQEQAQETENDEVLHALAADARNELIEIDNALSRIRNGTYGVCVACGDIINPERLAAYPMAIRCMECTES